MAKPSVVAVRCAAILGLLFFAAAAIPARGDGEEGGPYLPVGAAAEYRPAGMGELKGVPCGICGDCRCCRGGDPSGDCIVMKCCYRITCNIPSKPPGTCSLAPVSCGCNGWER